LNFSRKCTSDHFVYAIQVREKILQHSRSLYEGIFDEAAINGEWEKKGLLMVFKTEAEWHAHGKTNEYLKPYGLDAEPLVGDALFTREPSLREDVYGAWHHTADSHLRPETLLREMKEFLVERGTVIEKTAVCKALILPPDTLPGPSHIKQNSPLKPTFWPPAAV
jgi:D-amino-acid dehydrogenase